jgi:hypothetical protein
VACSCKHGDEQSGFARDEGFLHEQQGYHRVNKYCAPISVIIIIIIIETLHILIGRAMRLREQMWTQVSCAA